jgi:hypothetical protein
MTSSEVLEELTLESTIPLDYFFLIGDFISSWHAEQKGFVVYFIDDDPLDECVALLQQTERVFSNLRELREYAHAHSWANLAEFDFAVDDWERRLSTRR